MFPAAMIRLTPICAENASWWKGLSIQPVLKQIRKFVYEVYGKLINDKILRHNVTNISTLNHERLDPRHSPFVKVLSSEFVEKAWGSLLLEATGCARAKKIKRLNSWESSPFNGERVSGGLFAVSGEIRM